MPGVALGALRGDLSVPEEGDWCTVGLVEKLYLYPVKSLAHIQVDEMRIGNFAGSNGHTVDRQFMVTDSKGKFVSSRRYPQMALIQPKVTADQLSLKFPDKPDITISLKSPGQEKDVNVWGDPCKGLDLGEEASKWISEVIVGKAEGGLRLVVHPTDTSTRTDKTNDPHLMPLIKAGDKPFFADGMPYLLLSAASVQQLNENLKEIGNDLQVEETRFRPNIFVSGEFEGYAEDKWSYIKIGSAVFRNVKPCSRCIFTTVDPTTGIKDPKGQPLKLLREVRNSEDPVEKKAYGNSPFFGINLGAEVEGTIAVGQQVQIRKSEMQ